MPIWIYCATNDYNLFYGGSSVYQIVQVHITLNSFIACYYMGVIWVVDTNESIYIYIQSYSSKNIYIQSQRVSVKMKNPNFQQSSNIYDFLVLISQNLWNFELQKCNTMRLSFPKHPVDITSASFFALLYMKQGYLYYLSAWESCSHTCITCRVDVANKLSIWYSLYICLF